MCSTRGGTPSNVRAAPSLTGWPRSRRRLVHTWTRIVPEPGPSVSADHSVRLTAGGYVSLRVERLVGEEIPAQTRPTLPPGSPSRLPNASSGSELRGPPSFSYLWECGGLRSSRTRLARN